MYSNIWMSMWSVWNWYALQCYCMVTSTLKAAASYFYFINKSVAEHFKMRLLQLSGSDALASSAWADSAWTTSAIATLSSIIRRTMCLCFFTRSSKCLSLNFSCWSITEWMSIEHNALQALALALLGKRLKHEYYCAIDTIYITHHVTLFNIVVHFLLLLLFWAS